jgi:hypothetical protein
MPFAGLAVVTGAPFAGVALAAGVPFLGVAVVAAVAFALGFSSAFALTAGLVLVAPAAVVAAAGFGVTVPGVDVVVFAFGGAALCPAITGTTQAATTPSEIRMPVDLVGCMLSLQRDELSNRYSGRDWCAMLLKSVTLWEVMQGAEGAADYRIRAGH